MAPLSLPDLSLLDLDDITTLLLVQSTIIPPNYTTPEVLPPVYYAISHGSRKQTKYDSFKYMCRDILVTGTYGVDVIAVGNERAWSLGAIVDYSRDNYWLDNKNRWVDDYGVFDTIFMSISLLDIEDIDQLTINNLISMSI